MNKRLLRRQVVALNQFLGKAFRSQTRISDVLLELGLSQEQVAGLKERHLERIVASVRHALVRHLKDVLPKNVATAVVERHFAPGEGSARQKSAFERKKEFELQRRAFVLLREAGRRAELKQVVLRAASSVLKPLRDQQGAGIARRGWDSSEDRELLALIAEDWSVQVIAVLLERQEADVRFRLEKLGVDDDGGKSARGGQAGRPGDPAIRQRRFAPKEVRPRPNEARSKKSKRRSVRKMDGGSSVQGKGRGASSLSHDRSRQAPGNTAKTVSRRRWAPSEDRKLRVFLDEGRTLPVVAVVLGRQIEDVSSRLEELGIRHDCGTRTRRRGTGKPAMPAGRESNAKKDLPVPHRQRLSSRYGFCRQCGVAIPQELLDLNPRLRVCSPCLDIHDRQNVPPESAARVDEGLAGSRQDVKRARAGIWGDLRRRGRK